MQSLPCIYSSTGYKIGLTICDCVLPWCFLANSAFASPFPRPEGFRCAGSALFNVDAIVTFVDIEIYEGAREVSLRMRG